jgi:hypothetical protein
MITLTILEATYLLDVLGECMDAIESSDEAFDGIINAKEILIKCLNNMEDVEIPDGKTDIFY